MAIRLRWVNPTADDLKKVAEARHGAYGYSLRDRERFALTTPTPGQEHVLAEDRGRPVATATAIDKRIWVRGAPHLCQGVAWVGTLRTHRRGTGAAGRGAASLLMHETLRRARDKEQLITTLMPFRASFYEHFGYGAVERRLDWTVPLSVLPPGDFAGMRFMEPADLPEMMRCRQRIAEAGQCDMERPKLVWDHWVKGWEDAFAVVDRPRDSGPVHGWVSFGQYSDNGKQVAAVRELFADSPEALRRQIHFLASLRDQYSAVQWSLPADWPLHWLLRERQVGHTFGNHARAYQVRLNTRMMARVLDHKKLIEAMRLPEHISGKAIVAVHETEGHVTRLSIRIDQGQATVKPSAGATAQAHCDDRTWAALVLGDLPATAAARLGVLDCHVPSALALLDTFAQGPAPYCGEHF